MIRTGVHFQLAVHRFTELRLGEHPAHGFLDEAFGPLPPHDAGALLPQPALVAGVLTIDLLLLLAPGQLHARRVDDHHVIAQIEERRIGGLVLALEQPRSPGRDAPEDLPLSIEQMRAVGVRGVARRRHECGHAPSFPRRKPLYEEGRPPNGGRPRQDPRSSSDPGRMDQATVNPNHTNVSGHCQALESSVERPRRLTDPFASARLAESWVTDETVIDWQHTAQPEVAGFAMPRRSRALR